MIYNAFNDMQLTFPKGIVITLKSLTCEAECDNAGTFQDRRNSCEILKIIYYFDVQL